MNSVLDAAALVSWTRKAGSAVSVLGFWGAGQALPSSPGQVHAGEFAGGILGWTGGLQLCGIFGKFVPWWGVKEGWGLKGEILQYASIKGC